MSTITITVEIMAAADGADTRLKVLSQVPEGAYTKDQVAVWMAIGYAINDAAKKVGFDGFDCMSRTGAPAPSAVKGH